jgi:hypothetical protein
VARPKQLQLNARNEGVGVAIANVGTGARIGAIAVVTGAGNCEGAAGGGTGAINGFVAVCAHNDASERGHPSAAVKIAASSMIAIPFTARNVFRLIGTEVFIR